MQLGHQYEPPPPPPSPKGEGGCSIVSSSLLVFISGKGGGGGGVGGGGIGVLVDGGLRRSQNGCSNFRGTFGGRGGVSPVLPGPVGEG